MARGMLVDDITRAVLARDEVVRYLNGSHGETGEQAEERVHSYLDELRTRQRHAIYRVLKHPLYPIFRKIDRSPEHIERVKKATARHRVVYVSNHRSHLDYLLEPLVLEDTAIRPPVIAAGINLFGGPLGLIHKHVTGAIPIRRNVKDPGYLITLKAYIAEILGRHDLMFYIEGGRSYSGELKPPKTGLVNAALGAERSDLVFVPCAIAYDLVLEDHVLAHQKVKRRQRPFSRELAEMVRYAVGYRSRAFVTFGEPMTPTGIDVHSRRDVLEFAHHIRDTIGRLMKVLPTMVMAAAMRPSISRSDLESRVARIVETLQTAGANLETTSRRAIVEEAGRLFDARGVVVKENGLFRVRERTVLRYYARAIEHLLPVPISRTH
jgi:1-acyl-sn-glycerol-3-phosphate acyltransferase